MAYVILSDRKGEFDRRELRDVPLVVGRALECDVCVRDILLSRQHCRIEPFDKRWVVSDLGSKNGTRVNNEGITRQVLSDGDVIRLGKIQISFHVGAFIPRPANQPQRRDVRPADPTEALSGTVLGFQLFDMEEDSRISGFPIPRPRPAEPASYRQEVVQSMVAQIASNSWDLSVTEMELREQPATATAVKPPPEIVHRQQEIRRDLQEKAAAAPSGLLDAASASAGTFSTTAVAPSAHVRAEPRAVIRSRTPAERATIPGWLAVTYVLFAAFIAAASAAVILAHSL